ncbi:ribosomal protection-like ABC-F family protein [Lentzea flava]|uniref:ABC transporter ATP-binding protein n=1 Tax=Lentzea flava TaxID=103732 RepID=A0ABQ2UGQ9_9PSEU|nr:ABC-F family ATP-binding cassette domain-containing protein [Lentzea flava]MCP2199012.1 macrolide transport system ATP-binding/permease protein [Lentzea flava]GGU32290.1 ABC transporter ATP-binding protein [Lentzea flava]
MSGQLTLRSVSKTFAHRRVLDAVSLTVRAGEKLGVVGENGSGKSTLLRLIAGQETPDDGEITVVAEGGVGHLGQVLELPDDATVGDAVDAALVEIRVLEQRITAAAQDLGTAAPAELAEYGELLTAFELRDGYSADARVEAAMSALGIGDLGRHRQLGTLSGGQRARLALAGVLSAEPELLLLDEPTNHLDHQALTWLEDRLRAHRGTLVVVTHDRLLLERVVTAIVEVDGDRRTITRYGNGYAGYLAEKRAARQRWEQAYAEWVAEIAHWTEWRGTTAYNVAPGRAIKDHNKCKYNGDGRRVQASISTRVRSASERLERLRADPVPKPPDPLHLNAPLDAAVREGAVLELRQVSVGRRLRVDELDVAAGQRLLVTGPNGAGKSTLLDVLAGVLQPDHGTVTRHGVVGYLPQETVVRHPRRTVLAAFAEGRPGTRDDHASQLGSLGLFREADFATPVGALSIGQRRRLALARLLVQESDVLLLDEPTNHLSLALVEELEVALADYPGAVVVVSHDRLLRQRWRGDELELSQGRVLVPAL